jgi:hypothetical protein
MDRWTNSLFIVISYTGLNFLKKTCVKQGFFANKAIYIVTWYHDNWEIPVLQKNFFLRIQTGVFGNMM